MTTYKTIDRITELLRNSDLAWLLPNLRQDFMVWKSLNDPEFYEKFVQHKPAGSEFTPIDFSPSRLALIALDQLTALNKEPRELLDSLDNQVLQTAIRSFNDQTLFLTYPHNLATAGLIALALAYKYRTTSSWNGLLDTIQDNPGTQWYSPLVCLHGFIEKDAGLLNSLVQPGASTLRLDIAAHMVLSSPVSSNDQVANLMELCYGMYGDLLPASDRLSLIRSLSEQRPQSAVDFCLKWLEITPSQSKPKQKNHNNTDEDINQMAKNLFQIEINKITGKYHDLSVLLNNEKDLTHNLSSGLVNHYASHITKYQKGKSFTQELSAIRDQIIHLNGYNTSSGKISANKAELALILLDHGYEDEANQMLPQPEAPLPDDLMVLYAIAKISDKSGNHRRASESADRIMDILRQNSAIGAVSVWGDHLSLINIGKLLLGLHQPENASHIFNLALITCPNDSTLLQLLADSYKSSHQDQEAVEILRTLVSLNPANMDHH